MKVHPSKGGCWYCYRTDGDLSFSHEFDTWIHTTCIAERYENNKAEGIYDPENEIFMREFGLEV